MELTISSAPGNQPPTVSITSPSDGATFTEGDNITINADAADSDGSVTLVEFFQGSTKLGEDATSPYSYTWNSVAAGSYSLTAKATDNGGATTTSSAVNITVNEAPPSGSSMEAEDMSLTNYVVNTNSAASGGELIKLSASGVTGNATYNFSDSSGTYDIKVWYWDENDGECTFRIYVGGTMVDEWVANQNLGSADPVAQTRTSRIKTGVSISNGAQIKLEAVQNNQEWGRFDLVELTASGGPGNQPPTVSITSPSEGATFTEGDNITINADASDSDGSVTLVEFFEGSTKLGEDNSSPYSYTWNNVSAGSYALTAKATDNEGAATTSSAVNITVNEPPGGFPVDLQGTTPEEKTVNLDATKPADATDATLEMVVYDPDQTDEGTLYINGDVNTITLFGSQGTSANDGATVTVTYNTPASCWNDGANSLRFTHTSTGGYRVESASVTFTTAPPPGDFPVDLQGTTPEEKTVNLDAIKPGDATDATLEMVVYDPDQADEGTLYINGDINTITLFGSQGTSGNDGATVTVTYNIPASWWNDGSNSLRFTHTSTGGYRVESASVTFSTAPPPGDFPVDLQGTTPEEATVSLDVVKEPADATDATLSMVVYDPDQANEGTLYINGDVNTITLFGSQGVSGNDQQTVTVTYDTPASWWFDGANSLRFTHTSTGGYRVESASVSFSSGPPPPPPTARWIGEDGSSLADFNSLVGGQAQVHLRFCGWTWNQNFSSAASAITQDAADGGITMWSMQAEVTNAEILSGSYDSYLHTWASDAAADGRNFLLRFNHEMNGDWYEWAYGNDHLGNTPENYAQAWRHVHDIFTQEGATNVKWVFCPNTGYTSTASYPGDAYVDYVGIDGYNWGTTEPWSSWQTFTQIFQTAYNTLTSLTDKPVIICETSCFEEGGNKADWITSAFLTEIPTSFPEIIGVIWFNEGSFVINTSPEALAAFQNVVANPGWQGTFTLP